jgi:hypothetical protein
MSTNQPPTTNDSTLDAWLTESTNNTSRLEQKIIKLLRDIREVNSFDDLKERTKND